jgi:2,4-dienoyl-CoA reductase-like NADH-dependent reductase (Old Yellow Enzyme family)
MSERDIEDVIAAYGASAALAYRLGSDGIQIHAAHGYLIDQFFWTDTNRRSDRYGGDMASRGRLACEIVAECRRQTAPDFPLSLRYSQWKQQDFQVKLAPTPQLLAAFLEPLVDAGVDLFDASTRRFWEPEFANSPLNLAGWTRKLTGKVVATVGSVSLKTDFFASLQSNAGTARGNIARLIEMMERGDFDLVNIGRALISDPDWPSKVRRAEWSSLQDFRPEVLNTLI